MKIKSIEEASASLVHLSLASLDDASQDISVLAHMAHIALHAANQLQRGSSFFSLPFISTYELPGGRSYRIVTNTHLPLNTTDLPFVGFMSKKRDQIAEEVEMSLANVDRHLVEGMVKQSGLLSYSSLQLADGNWCNLVIFEKPDAKQDISTMPLHQYAAYHLAPCYYQWVRLHHGELGVNSASRDSPFVGTSQASEKQDGRDTVSCLILHVTKHYTFNAPHQRPSIQVQTHLPSTTENLIPNKGGM